MTRGEVWRERLAVFSDCLLLGLLIAVSAVPLVTAPAGFAAGCAVIAGWRAGDGPRLVPALATVLRNGLRRHLLAGLGFLAAGLVLALDLTLAATVLPGGAVVRWLVAGVSLGLFAVLVRAAAVVGARGLGWLAALRESAGAWLDHPGELLLLTGMVAAAGVLVWMLPPLALVIGGPMALAATALAGQR